MWQRAVSLVFAGAGLAAIYLSQVRISLVVTLGMLIAYALISLRQGRIGRATQFAILGGGIFVGSFMLAVALGGPTVLDRFITLFAGDPLAVYRNARGVQLDVHVQRDAVRTPARRRVSDGGAWRADTSAPRCEPRGSGRRFSSPAG